MEADISKERESDRKVGGNNWRWWGEREREMRWKDKKGKTEKMTQSRCDRSDTETHLGIHADWQIS